jgi:hypothetical protein
MTDVLGWLKTKCEKVFRAEEWNVGIVRRPIQSFLESSAEPEVHWLPMPKRGEFIADPFGICCDGSIRLLYEKYDYDAGKGVISCLTLTDGKIDQPERLAIDPPCHASYPYLVRHGGEIYCIPETSAAREVALYKACEFPHKWERSATLIQGLAAVDSTIFEHEGRWWLMCSDADLGPDSTLLVWHSRSLFGPWEPHAANPVKVDASSARPAGTPFVHEGSLYRPGQDCSKTYGGRVVIHKVTQLTPDEYAEEPASTIVPLTQGPFREGLHTISSAGDVTLVDGKRRIFMWKAICAGIRYHIAAGRKRG